VNVISIINFSYKVIFSQAIKQTAFSSELGTVPVTFHMEAREESILPDADMQCTICYSSHKANEMGEKRRAHTLCRNLITPHKFRGRLGLSNNLNTLPLA
jgi:hypothetical protein